MNKIWTVAAREFVETVRTRAFLLSVVMMPALIVLSIFGTQYVAEMGKKERVETRRIAVIDHAGNVFAALEAQVAKFNLENPNRRFELVSEPAAEGIDEKIAERARVSDLYGYIIVPDDVVDGEGKVTIGRRDQQLEVGRRLDDIINSAVVAVRFAKAQPPVDLGYIRRLQRDVPINTIDVATGKAETGDRMVRFMTPFAFMFMLMIATFGISQGLLTSVMEEKSSRVVEVLLSAVSPTQLMAGKILGMAGVGLVLLCVWGGAGYYGAHARNMDHLISTYRLTYVVLYFVPGFLLSAAILAAIGSACNELKEAQSMTFPISLLNLIPVLFWFYITENPNSLASIVVSYIPPITPFVMILRICADPETPMWQVVTTLLVLWASVFLAMWAAGKVFRVGVLMYGKPPSPRELLRWIRYA